MALEFDLGGLEGEQIGRLLGLLARTDVTECDIEQGDCRLSIKRLLPDDQSRATPPPPVEVETHDEPTLVHAPAVGIFHRSESRSGHPPVDVGSRVKAGDVLGCVQVMAMPHLLFSPLDGVVEGFLVEDGQAVEYGQPVVEIRGD